MVMKFGLTPRKEHASKLLERRLVRVMFGSRTPEATGG
jgi:hypothetical protein